MSMARESQPLLPQVVETWLYPDHGGLWKWERVSKNHTQDPKSDPSRGTCVLGSPALNEATFHMALSRQRSPKHTGPLTIREARETQGEQP